MLLLQNDVRNKKTENNKQQRSEKRKPILTRKEFAASAAVVYSGQYPSLMPAEDPPGEWDSNQRNPAQCNTHVKPHTAGNKVHGLVKHIS